MYWDRITRAEQVYSDSHSFDQNFNMKLNGVTLYVSITGSKITTWNNDINHVLDQNIRVHKTYDGSFFYTQLGVKLTDYEWLNLKDFIYKLVEIKQIQIKTREKTDWLIPAT